MAVKLFVEGDADVKFLADYIKATFGEVAFDLVNLGGYTNLEHKAVPEFIANPDGPNLVILDADFPYNNGGFDKRREEIEKLKAKAGVDFGLFLFPDHRSDGDLESLLCSIISNQHKGIFTCWDEFENCLKGKSDDYTLPASKSKVHTYLEVLHGRNDSEKKKCKERNRDYTNSQHWDIKNAALDRLNAFLTPAFT